MRQHNPLLILLAALLALGLTALPLAQSLSAQDEEDTEFITIDDEEGLEPEEEADIDEIEDIEEIEVEMVEDSPEPSPTPLPTVAPTAVPTPEPAPAAETMRDLYQQGIEYYQQKKYVMALDYLTRSCHVPKDASTPTWLYGEANAMRGVIYQFYSKDPERYKLAYQAYRLALDWDKLNKTARRHINDSKILPYHGSDY